jgi:hypothetical protein
MAKAPLPKVTPDNYYDPDIAMAYMGSTQFKSFQRCEAAALAELRGEYVAEPTTALLVGGFVDAYFSKELQSFMEKHPEIFKKDGSLKSDFVQADEIIFRMESDRLYSLLMSGKKQVIRTGTIAGVPFKIKIDSLLDAATCEEISKEFPKAGAALGLCDGAIVDQKVMRNIDDVWSDEERRRIPFVEAWGYDIQGAIYQAIEGHMLPFILAVGTKEAEPNLAALYIPDQDLAAKMAEVEDMAPRYQAIKEGRIQPKRCERCDYCRATRQLDSILSYKML